jgi:hypothetical protein
MLFKRRKWFQWLCGKATGHAPSNDSGYWVDDDGHPMKDYWCKWCDKMYTVKLSDAKVDRQKFLLGRLGSMVKHLKSSESGMSG